MGTVIVLLWLIGFPVGFALLTYKNKVEDKLEEEAKERKQQLEEERKKGIKHYINGVYCTDTNTLEVTQRGPNIKKQIFIEKTMSVTTTRTPEKTWVGAATVGGVTTGGTFKTGGYTEEHYSKAKCVRMTYGYQTSYTIDKIELSPELLAIAKESEINKYVSGDCILVNTGCSHSTFMMNYQRGKIDADSMGYPTRTKAEEILNWLAGE